MENLKGYILSLGADLVGFADLTSLPAAHRLNMPFGIAIAIAINPEIVPLILQKATMEYYNEYQNLNDKLDKISDTLKNYIYKQGYNAISQTVDFVKEQRVQNNPNNPSEHALMPHKTVAALSGLGWIAKNSLLITKKYGSAVRLTSVLTDAPISVSKSTYKCLCGDCKICYDACPGNAIKNKVWSIETDRDELIDFYACRKTVKNRGNELGINNGACGICMAVCPYTQKYLQQVK